MIRKLTEKTNTHSVCICRKLNQKPGGEMTDVGDLVRFLLVLLVLQPTTYH